MGTTYGATAMRDRDVWVLDIPILDRREGITDRHQVEVIARRLVAHLGEVSVEWIDDDASPGT